MGNFIAALVRDIWQGGRSVFHRVRRHYVYVAVGPTITALYVAAILQLILLAVAGYMLYSLDCEGLLADVFLPTATVGVILIAFEIGYATWLLPAVPHPLRNEEGVIVRFPRNLPQIGRHRVLPDGRLLNAAGQYVNTRGGFVDLQGEILPQGQHPVVHDQMGQNVPGANGQLVPFPENLPVIGRHRVLPDGRLLDDRGRFLNTAGNFVDEEGTVIAEGSEPVRHVRADEPAQDPVHRHLPGRYSLGWSVLVLTLTSVIISCWIGWNGIALYSTRVFMAGVFGFYATLAPLALLAWFVAGTLSTNQRLVGIAARIRGLIPFIAVFPIPLILVTYRWTNPDVAMWMGGFLLLSTCAGIFLAANGGRFEADEMRYRFARYFAWSIMATYVGSGILAFVPQIWLNALLDELTAVDPSWWRNLLAALIFIGLGAFLLRVRRWTEQWQLVSKISTVAAMLAFAAFSLDTYALVRNIHGKGDILLPRLEKEETARLTCSPPRELSHGALLNASLRFRQAMREDASDNSAAAASSKGEEPKPDRTPPAPAPTVTSKPPSGGGRDKPPSRYARAPGSPAPNSPRWKLDPEFVTEYRAVTGEDP